MLLNSLKFNIAGFLAVKYAGRISQTDLATAIAMLAFTNCIPVAFYIIINRRRDDLQIERNKLMIGALYKGRNVTVSDHKAQLYPIMFFWRRGLFVAATVYMFDHPVIQMSAHYLLTILTIIIYLKDRFGFDSPAQRFVEIGSEIAMLVISVMLAQFMDLSLDEAYQIEMMQIVSLGGFGVLVTLNLVYIVWYFAIECKEKNRKKKLV